MHPVWKQKGRWFQAYLGPELFGEYKQRGDEALFDVRLYAPGKRLTTRPNLAEARRAVEEHIAAFMTRAARAGYVMAPVPDDDRPEWDMTVLGDTPATYRVRARDAAEARRIVIERYLYGVPRSMSTTRLT